MPAVGAPVPASTLIARWLLACREGPQRIAKSEAACGVQPGKPCRRSHLQPMVFSVSPVHEGLTLHDRLDLVLVLHAHHQISKDKYPNSIAHVRELLRVGGFRKNFIFSYKRLLSRSKVHGLLGYPDE